MSRRIELLRQELGTRPVGGPALRWEIPDNQLERLPGTDVRFRTYVARADLPGQIGSVPG